jgi:hypothetical protein
MKHQRRLLGTTVNAKTPLSGISPTSLIGRQARMSEEGKQTEFEA